MKLALGPILYAVDCTRATWKFRVMVFSAAGSHAAPHEDDLRFEPADVTVDPPVAMADLSTYGLGRAWSWTVSIPRREAERRVRYTLRHSEGETTIDHVYAPARDRLPRIAVTSCSGFSAGDVDPGSKRKPFELWQRMRNLHETPIRSAKTNPSGFHLLIGGGDQIYNDAVKIAVGGTTKTVAKLVETRPDVAAATFLRDARRAYFANYVEHFSIPEIAAMSARLPAQYTWDDHELFDGCGSYDHPIQNHPTVKLLRRAARDAFVTFQLGADPAADSIASVSPQGAAGGDDPDTSHFLQWACFEAEEADLDVILLDLRSGRTMTRVLAPAQREALESALNAITNRVAGKARHVLVVSSIPLVHARHSRLLRMLPALPRKLGLGDDLLDQWEHSLHSKEQLELVDRLFRAQALGCRVTIVSGDVHSGAALLIKSTRPEHRRKGARIPLLQLTSSGIVHPPPPVGLPFLEEFVEANGERLADGLTTEFAVNAEQAKSIFEPNYASIHFEPKRANDFSFAGRAWFERKILGPLGPIAFKA